MEQDSKPNKLLIFFVLIGLLTCVFLIVVDLRIKGELITQAKDLEARINGARGEFPDQSDNPDGGLRNFVPDSGENPNHSGLEVGEISEALEGNS